MSSARLVAALVLVGLCGGASAAQADVVQLRYGPGSMMLGGRATFDIDTRTLAQANGEEETLTGYKFRLAPEIGYFVHDSLALLGTILVDYGFGDLYKEAGGQGKSKRAGLELGLRYFLPLAASEFYAGLQFGIGVQDEDVDSTCLTLPLGFLIALTPDLALDLGARITYETQEESPDGKGLHVPIGYLGVQAIF